MALPTGVDLLPDSVLKQLAPGERPLCAETATQLAGHSAIGQRSEQPRANVSVDLNPVSLLTDSGGLYVDPDWMSAKLGGVNAAGAHGSPADQMTRILTTSACRLLLTDRRLALVADTAGLLTLKVDMRIVFSVDRKAVTAIERRPRLLQRGRVRITFVDGSWAMVMLGMLFAGAAKRLVRAFHGGAV